MIYYYSTYLNSEEALMIHCVYRYSISKFTPTPFCYLLGEFETHTPKFNSEYGTEGFERLDSLD